jgi:hypothetical protein
MIVEIAVGANPESHGCSILFFCGAIKILGRLYPNRVCAQPMNEMLEHLIKLEELYKSLPTIENKPKKKPKGTP